MNAQQRKIIRDGHLRRLGGLGSTVLVANRHKANLHRIDGADTAVVTFPYRSAVSIPLEFRYRAGELTPRRVGR